MKKFDLIIIAFILSVGLFMLINCSEDEKENKNLTLSKVEYGGCFKKFQKSTTFDAGFLSYKISTDTLILSATLNLNCCAELKDSVSINNKFVNIFVCDTAGKFCWCGTCNFDLIYSFSDFSDKNIKFSLFYKAFNNNQFSLLAEKTY
jgi:hypothetical protein